MVPPDLVGTENLRGEKVRESLYPIFRDEDELPANADLATGIRAALEVSDFLIVLCSPRSVESPWVRKEVREFKELGRSDRILAIIIAGEPNADDPAKAREGIGRDEECFCKELRSGAVREDGTLDWAARTEPLAADLRPNGMRAEGFVTAEAYREHLTETSSYGAERIAAMTEAYRQRLDLGLFKVIAGLLGLPLGQLTERDAAYRASLAKQEAARQREIAERERERALADESRKAEAKAREAESAAQAAKKAAERTARRLAVAGGGGAQCCGGDSGERGVFPGGCGGGAENGDRAACAAEKRGRDLQAATDTQDKLLREQKKQLYEASMADYATAVQRIDKDGKWHEEVAHLARSLKWWPENPQSAARLYTTLSFYAAEQQIWPKQVLHHKDIVSGARFSPDGTRIVTTCGNAAQVWDAASGKALGEPLRHEDSVVSAQFSPDGSRIVTASDDKTARMWDAKLLLHAPPSADEWMLQFADVVAGLKFDVDGQLKNIPGEERLAILSKPVSGKDPWAKLARWLVLPAAERTLTPDSKFTCRQIAKRERDSGYKEGIESALRYDPTVPLAHLILAKFEENPQRAVFLRDYELKRLPEDAALWARAACSLIDQKDFNRALKAADKALLLAPNNAEALKARAAAVAGMNEP